MALAFDLMSSLPMLVIILLGLGLVLAAGASWAHAHNHAALADDLDIAHEALDCVGEVGKLVTQGVPLPEAIMKVAPSNEAQDLLRRFKVFAHLSVLLLAFIFFAGCSAEQLAREEAAAHAALSGLEKGIDWLNANPATVNALLDDAESKSSDAGMKKAIEKARAAVAKGDLVAAQKAVSLGAALTAPTQ